MNKTQALTKLRKLLGKDLAYRINKDAVDPSFRPRLIEEAKTLMAERNEAAALKEARYKVLMQDPEYRRLVAEHKALAEQTSSACHRATTKSITVGVNGGTFFSVRAEADNWQDIVDIVEKRNG